MLTPLHCVGCRAMYVCVTRAIFFLREGAWQLGLGSRRPALLPAVLATCPARAARRQVAIYVPAHQVQAGVDRCFPFARRCDCRRPWSPLCPYVRLSQLPRSSHSLDKTKHLSTFGTFVTFGERERDFLFHFSSRLVALTRHKNKVRVRVV